MIGMIPRKRKRRRETTKYESGVHWTGPVSTFFQKIKPEIEASSSDEKDVTRLFRKGRKPKVRIPVAIYHDV